MNRPFTVVLTGVENAQKTTIGHLLAERNGWPLIEESARFDAAVIAGQVALKDLQRLQDQFMAEVHEQIRTSTAPVLLCDTGGLVLDIWAREVFGGGLKHTEEAMRLMDLHCCSTRCPNGIRTPYAPCRDMRTESLYRSGIAPVWHRAAGHSQPSP